MGVISLDRLAAIFPENEPNFTPPFRVHTDDFTEVHIYDTGDNLLCTFCRVTQLPINDDRALAAEVRYWEIEAGRVVAALNAAYPRNAPANPHLRRAARANITTATSHKWT
jgi:hypothetical protein